MQYSVSVHFVFYSKYNTTFLKTFEMNGFKCIYKCINKTSAFECDDNTFECEDKTFECEDKTFAFQCNPGKWHLHLNKLKQLH